MHEEFDVAQQIQWDRIMIWISLKIRHNKNNQEVGGLDT